MGEEATAHSICRWSFGDGEKGFTPKKRPQWSGDNFSTVDAINWTGANIKPRLPDNLVLGFEMHVKNELNRKNAQAVVRALRRNGIYLAMATPAGHKYFADGGIASLNPAERRKAEQLGIETVDLLYVPSLMDAWHPDRRLRPTLVLWNGSWVYRIHGPHIPIMYANAVESTAKLCDYERSRGREINIAIEKKRDEGGPAHLVQAGGDVLVFWDEVGKYIGQEKSDGSGVYDFSLDKKGENEEGGHTDIVGLCQIQSAGVQLRRNKMKHRHCNSQGSPNYIRIGGQGMFDIDHGYEVTPRNIALEHVVDKGGYDGWHGHDMQPSHNSSIYVATDEIVRAVLSLEACKFAGRQFDGDQFVKYAAAGRNPAMEDMLREAHSVAGDKFKELYQESLDKLHSTDIRRAW